MPPNRSAPGDEAAGPLAQLLPIPQDPGDPDGDLDGDDDPLAQLRADVTAARGKALLVETTSAGYGEGRASAPQKDWVAERLGPDTPAAVVEAARDAFARMVAACGSNVSLFTDADGTAQREALRRWHMGTVLPVARMIEWELSEKLDADVRLKFDAYPQDIAGRASAFKAMVTAGADVAEALAVTGLLADDG